ncbi:MAG: DinB family protein [Candidatus Kapabacteria bacterium]|nr:DinB family protein [Candidatus Kapabacteria bacterium]
MNITQHFQMQYGAALEMMRTNVAACPDELWNNPQYGNRFWHIAYHSLFYTAFYLSPSEAQPVLWSKCKPSYQMMGRWSQAPTYNPNETIPYTKEEINEFIDFLLERITVAFDETDYDAPSGISWISFNRFGLYMYNLRHLQHHIGQLSERIRQVTGSGTGWIGKV